MLLATQRASRVLSVCSLGGGLQARMSGSGTSGTARRLATATGALRSWGLLHGVAGCLLAAALPVLPSHSACACAVAGQLGRSSGARPAPGAAVLNVLPLPALRRRYAPPRHYPPPEFEEGYGPPRRYGGTACRLACPALRTCCSFLLRPSLPASSD